MREPAKLLCHFEQKVVVRQGFRKDAEQMSSQTELFQIRSGLTVISTRAIAVPVVRSSREKEEGKKRERVLLWVIFYECYFGVGLCHYMSFYGILCHFMSILCHFVSFYVILVSFHECCLCSFCVHFMSLYVILCHFMSLLPHFLPFYPHFTPSFPINPH